MITKLYFGRAKRFKTVLNARRDFCNPFKKWFAAGEEPLPVGITDVKIGDRLKLIWSNGSYEFVVEKADLEAAVYHAAQYIAERTKP